MEKTNLSNTAPPARAYSVQTVAQCLGVTEVRVRREIAEGRLRAARIGRLWRIRSEDLERYLEGRMAAVQA